MARPRPPDMPGLELAALDSRNARWIVAAAQTAFLYDVFLTLPYEYRYIWRAKWRFGKIMYILVRYLFNLGLLAITFYSRMKFDSTHTVGYCLLWTSWSVLGGCLQVMTAQLILGLRVTALYNMNRLMVIFVCTLGLLVSSVQVLFSIVFITCVINNHKVIPLDAPVIGCFQVCMGCRGVSRYIPIPVMTFDAVVFLLTLYKHSQHSQREPQTRLLSVLYRDGFIYFVVIFSASFTNFLFLNVARPSLVASMIPLLRTILGIACGRLLLNLRGVIVQSPFEDLSPWVQAGMASRSLDTLASAGIGVWNTEECEFKDLTEKCPLEQGPPSASDPKTDP